MESKLEPLNSEMLGGGERWLGLCQIFKTKHRSNEAFEPIVWKYIDFRPDHIVYGLIFLL